MSSNDGFPPPPSPTPPPPAPTGTPIAVKAESASRGLRVFAGLAGVLAFVFSAASSIRFDRARGVTVVPEPPAILGAGIAGVLIPALIGFVVAKTSTTKSGLVAFTILALLVVVASVVRLGLGVAA